MAEAIDTRPSFRRDIGAAVRDRAELRDRAQTLLEESQAVRRGWAARPPAVLVGAGTVEGLRWPDTSETIPAAEISAAIERASLDPAIAQDPEQAVAVYWTLRGAAGELHAADLLAAGDLPVPSGTASVELVDHYQPGTDLVFRDAAGTVLDQANVKIARTTSVVTDHFARHPDVRVVYAPTDTAESLAAGGWVVRGAGDPLPDTGPVVVDLGQPTAWFDDHVAQAFHGPVEGLASTTAFVPWFGLGIVLYRAARRLQGGDGLPSTLQHAGSDTAVVTGATVAAKGASVVAGGILAPVAAAYVGGTLVSGVLALRADLKQATNDDQQLMEYVRRLERQFEPQPTRLRRVLAHLRPGRRPRSS